MHAISTYRSQIVEKGRRIQEIQPIFAGLESLQRFRFRFKGPFFRIHIRLAVKSIYVYA